MFSEGENAAFLLEAGQPVVVDGVSGTGILSRQTELVLDGESTWIGETLLALSSLAGGVSYGDLIIIGSESYRVAQSPFPSIDGVFCRVPLSGPIPYTPPTPVAIFLATTTGVELTTTTGTPIPAL